MSRTRQLALLLAVLALVVGACASQPFTEESRVAVGLVEESIGDDFSLSAQSLSAEWTFTEEAPFTLSFEGGTVAYNGVELESGCFSGESTVDAVLRFDGAEDVEFVTPAEDPACQGLPD